MTSDRSTVQVALLGDDRGHPSHVELNALRPRLAAELDAAARWVPTDADFDVDDFDGVWLVPGSPYADDGAVFAALTRIRTAGIPFLGTCGGLQYATLEYLRSVLRVEATHAESDGERADNGVTALACSLYGEQRLVTPTPGSRFAGWVPEPFVGMHYCNYAPSPASVAALLDSGVVLGASAPDAPAEVLEFPGHPFFVASLFQPHIGAAAGAPIHPLIAAFVDAARRGRRPAAEG